MRAMSFVFLLLLFFQGFGALNKPNILFILVDDYGWNNVGYHNSDKEVSTPTINELVKNGIELNRHYAYPFCSPSRSSLQSGRLPQHVNIVNAEPLKINDKNPITGFAGIPPKMSTIPGKLKEAGYKTAFTGKWDVGMASTAQSPKSKGYDQFLGYLHHANSYCSERMPIVSTGEVDVCQNRFIDLWVENDTYVGGSPKAGTAYEEEIFTEHSLNVIKNHNVSEPLFLFHSFHLLHSPKQIPRVWLKNFTWVDTKGHSDKSRIQYAAMAQYMDAQIAKFVNEFQKRNMWDNTLLVFVSDNGGPVYTPGAANNHPHRGGKFSDFEGGVRVNAFVSGGYIPKKRRGIKSEAISHIADWYTTFCSIAEIDPTDSNAPKYGLPKVDGVNLWPMLNGTEEKARDEIYITHQTIMVGDMKLITGYIPYDIRTGEKYPNNTCSPCKNATSCADCRQPGFNSGTWLPCEGKSCKSIAGDDYPKIFQHLGGWAFDCSPRGKIGCLFNVSVDPTESQDLSKDLRYMTILNQLNEKLKKHQKTDFNPDRGYESYLGCMMPWMLNGFYGPFVDENSKPLFPMNTFTDSLPPCDLCSTNTTKTTDTMCVHYPDNTYGFECTPFENGKCAPTLRKPFTLGRGLPLNATFLCGKGNYSRVDAWEGKFVYSETVANDIIHELQLKTGNMDNETPFVHPNMCKELDIAESLAPLHM